MAALVEEARWRTSASGKRYLLATCSDESGQFIASIFDDDAQEAVEAAARDGECALLSVELLWRAEEDTPRVTIRGLGLLDSLSTRTRISREVVIADAAALPELSDELEHLPGGRRAGRQLLSAGRRDAGGELGYPFVCEGEDAAR